MENKLEKLLNCNDEFRNHIDDFIEIFVEYYGEEQRGFIEERFNSALLVGYLSESFFKNVISQLEQNESEKLFKEIIENTSLDFSEQDLFGEFCGKLNSFEHFKSHPINMFCKFYEEYKLGEDGRIRSYYENSYKFLCERMEGIDLSFEEFMQMAESQEVPEQFRNKAEEGKKYLLSYTNISFEHKRYEERKADAVEFLQSIDSSITIDNIEERIPQIEGLDELLADYKNKKKIYDTDFKEKYKKYYKIIEYNEDLEKKLNENYYKQYLKEVFDIFPEQYREEITKYIAGDKSYLGGNITRIVGYYDIKSTCLWEYFSRGCTEKLNDEKTQKWEKDSIKNERIKYFKSMGIDLGDNYEDYLKRADIWPSQDTIENIIKRKEELKNDFYREYFNNMIPQKDRNQEEKDRGFLEYSPNDSAEIYLNQTTCVVPNVIETEEGYELAAKVVVLFNENETKDHFIIHELNHLYELELIGVNQDEVQYLCGWDIMGGNISEIRQENINLNREKRDYELFNEIINEKISKEISEMMVERGISIFGKATESSYRNVTSYDNTAYLVNEFFQTYKREILESRRNNNIQVIFDAIGKNNFDELNNLFKVHNNRFAGFSYYSLIKDLNEGKETERTRIFEQLKQQRDEILSKMQEHYKNYLESKKEKMQVSNNESRPTEEDLKAEFGEETIAESIRRFDPKELSPERENSKGE